MLIVNETPLVNEINISSQHYTQLFMHAYLIVNFFVTLDDLKVWSKNLILNS